MYATNDRFANPIALYHEEGLMRGVRIGQLEINPFAYNPRSGELRFFDNLKKLYNSPAFSGSFVRPFCPSARPFAFLPFRLYFPPFVSIS